MIIGKTTLHRVVGINRYIMECKFAWSDCFITASLELIDTLWNVNLNMFNKNKNRSEN